MTQIPLIIYHKADYDGKISRDVCLHWLPGTTLDYDTLGWDYGDPLPDISGRQTVYLVDISNDLLVPKNLEKIIWIDHHRTAMEKYGDQWKGVRLEGVAACRLCWQWFQAAQRGERLPSKLDYYNHTVEEPELVRLAGEYDVWDRRDPNAATLQYGMRALGVDSLQIRMVFEDKDPIDILLTWLAAGSHARGYALSLNISTADRGYEIVWEGLRWLVINTAIGNSETFTSRAKRTHDALLMWRWDGSRCKVSLYHAPGKEHLDLSKIATKYGGGGHPGACGFEQYYIPAQLTTSCQPISA